MIFDLTNSSNYHDNVCFRLVRVGYFLLVYISTCLSQHVFLRFSKDLVGANEQFWIGMVENNNGMWHWEGSNIDQVYI